MVADTLASPLCLLKTAIGKWAECAATFRANFGNEDHHGDSLVAPHTEETVGGITTSSVVVAHPNMPEDDLDECSATVESNKITIVGPAQPSPWLTRSKQWIKFLSVNSDVLDTAELATTMQALVIKMVDKKRKKTTVIDFAAHGITLTDAHLNAGSDGDNDLVVLPIPHTHTVKDDQNKEAEVTETICIWRVFIEDLEQALTSANTMKKKAAKERMMELKNGALQWSLHCSRIGVMRALSTVF